MKNLIAFTLLIVCFSVSECKKPKNAAVYDFTWTANPTVDDDVAFTSNAPAGSTFLWNFGDGGTSTYPVGTHFYDSAGVYTVCLVINGDDQHRVIKSVSVGGSPNFSYKGAQCTGDSIFFYSNILSGSTFLWNFGDGTTSADSKPYHIYSTPGKYNVTLKINAEYKNVYCKNPTIIILKDPIYTHLIVGTRLWHHTYDLSYIGDTNIIHGIPVDESFAINYIDPVSISLPQWPTDILQVVSSNDSTIEFDCVNGYIPGSDFGSRESHVSYYYVSDKIKIRLHWMAASHDRDDYYTE